MTRPTQDVEQSGSESPRLIQDAEIQPRPESPASDRDSSDTSFSSSGGSLSQSSSTQSWCPSPLPQSTAQEDKGGDSLIDIVGDEDMEDVVQPGMEIQPGTEGALEEVVDLEVNDHNSEGNIAEQIGVVDGEATDHNNEENAAEQIGDQENENAEPAGARDPSDMSWVSEKMRSFKNISTYATNVKFTMHRVVFEKMEIVPPFTEFQRES